MTDKPTIPAWLKEGAIVRCNAPIGVMRVTHVDDSGVSARRARSTRNDAFQQAHACFLPANIEDRILFVLDEARISEIHKINPAGKDERQFTVLFRERPVTTTIDTMKTLFDKVDSSENPAIVVTVPQSWLDELVLGDPVTPARLALAQSEADLIREKVKSGIPFAQLPPEREADPAVIAWLTKTLTDAGQDMTDAKVIPSHRLGRGMDESPTYAVLFAKTGQITVTQLDLKRVGLVEPVLNGTKITVDLPEGWTVGNGEQEAAPEVEDEALTETARRIKKLEAENARLLVQLAEREADVEILEERIEGFIQDIKGAAIRTEDVLEAADEPTALTIKSCIEVEFITFKINQRERVQDFVAKRNADWIVAHEEFSDDGETFRARLERIIQLPGAPPGVRAATAKFIESSSPLVSFQPVPSDTHGALYARPEKVHTFAENRLVVDPSEPPRNYGLIARERRDEEIATDRATLTAMSADMEVGHGEFTLAVRQSRLPRQEQDELVARSYKSRTMFQTQQDLAGWQPAQYRSFESLMAGAK